MTIAEPDSLEVFITVALGNLASPMFKEYVARLPLTGAEQLLELGPSAGNSTCHLARRLLKGGGCVTAVDISGVWVDVARRRLQRLPNVEILLGDVTTLDLPEGSYDALFFSFVVHEIPARDRLRILRCMVSKLIPAGKVFIREPLRFISTAEIGQLARDSGLVEISAAITEVPTQGQACEGIYQKPDKRL